MSGMPVKAFGYFFVAPQQPLERRDFTIENLESNEVIVQVAGCGLCHTDLGFIRGEVKTKKELPLILGHEISGRVVQAGESVRSWMKKNVIVPAVLPCGDCDLCRVERDNICQNQKMPGNDFHGGFASHLVVPARFLCEVPDHLGEYSLAQLSVIADAVTTPYQSLRRSGLRAGHLAIVVGVGGVGIYMVQHARSRGARLLVLDIDDAKLAHAQKLGADFVLNVRDLSEKAIKEEVRNLVKAHHLPKTQWKIFEMSGTLAGQSTAFSLLNFAGTLGIVGFTMDKLSIRLSNIMAFDADVFGNWGCRPAYYPDVLNQVLKNEINIRDNIQEFSLDQVNDVIERAQNHHLTKRAILTAC